MSHFIGLVVMTPKYDENHTIEDALDKYNENNDVPEYCTGAVSDKDKMDFLKYYISGDCKVSDEEFLTFYPDAMSRFDSLYEKRGDDWNSGRWRKDSDGVWKDYSTYNPDSKWDWWTFGGRWDEAIKTKSGEYVNECLLGEIDLAPFKDSDYKGEPEEDWLGRKMKVLKDEVRWHITENNLPFALVIDGEWYEKGKMGWWGITTDEISHEEWSAKVAERLKDLDPKSKVYSVDFHI